MSRRNNQNNYNYNGNQYYGNGQNYNGNNQYYNPNGQYNQNGQYNNNNNNRNAQYNNRNGQYYNQNAQYNQGQYNQNGQYFNKPNKFGLYDQPQQNNGNNNKKKKFNIDRALLNKIIMFAGFAIVLLLIVFSINSCGKKKAEDKDVVTVGTETYGYVSVPSDWVNFKNSSPIKSGVQYSDITTTYIVTLDALSTKDISAKEYALGYANELEKVGVSVQGAEVKLGKYDAFQVYGQDQSSKKWVLIYFFEAEDGNSHYVGVEGPDKSNEAFAIPESFTLKK